MLDEKITNDLTNLLGEGNVLFLEEEVVAYIKDYTMDSMPLICPKPAAGCVVVKPGNSSEISQVLRYANENKIPVIPRGGGTNIVAGAIPSSPSIIMSLEKMNKILDIDNDNMMITCECGVTLNEIIETMNAHDKLYFPLHPGDRGAHVGGMVSTNAGGVRAIRYGVMRDQVKGIEVVLPTGEIATFGNPLGKLIKNNAGYDLMHLLIGSEGTLGIITKATLRLVPKPKASGTLVLSFPTRADAFKAVTHIVQEGVTPVTIEYVERDQIVLTAENLNRTWPAKKGIADLIVVLAEESIEAVYNNSMVVEEVCSKFNMVEALITDRSNEQKDIIEIRSHVFTAIEKDVADLMDATVPRSKLVEFIDGVDMLSKRFNTRIPILAHAGDGNLHTFIMKENGSLPEYHEEVKNAIYQTAIDLGGTITGEHGIGLLRANDLKRQFTDYELELMRGIRKVFDPHNILNPGKKII